MSKGRCFFTLYKFELLKILKNKVAIVTFLIFFVFAFIQGEFEITGNIESSEIEKYKAFNGRVIDDTYVGELKTVVDEDGKFINGEDKTYSDLKSWIDSVYDNDADYANLNSAQIYEDRQANIEEGYLEEKLTEEEISYWRQKESEVDKPVEFFSTWIPSGVLEGTTNLSIFMIILVATSLAMIFSMETQRKTDPMIRTTVNGTRQLYFAKVLAGFSYIISCLLIMLIGFLGYLGIRWGFSGMSAAIQMYKPLASENMSVWQLEGILIGMLIMFSIFLSAFALYISNVTRNGVATMTVVIGGSIGMFALASSIPLEHRYLSQAVQLLSPSVISSSLVYEFRLIKLGRFFTVYEFVPMLYILLSIVLIIAGYIFYSRYEIKSN
ncbi:MAG: hypothetical protein K6E77_04580 [Lachnospiraceae bacterium]|nr:hypothetical protein [Lachnospiraceae bacterium]